MRIELDKLTSRVNEFVHCYEPNDFELDDEDVCIIEPLEIIGRVVKSELQVKVEGKFNTTAEVLCSRCLSKVSVKLCNEFDILYVPESTNDVGDTLELDEDDLTLSVLDGNVIDVDELAIEQIYLALPSRVLCKEDCLGLCPKCGKNKNVENCSCDKEDVDTRWAALKELL